MERSERKREKREIAEARAFGKTISVCARLESHFSCCRRRNTSVDAQERGGRAEYASDVGRTLGVHLTAGLFPHHRPVVCFFSWARQGNGMERVEVEWGARERVQPETWLLLMEDATLMRLERRVKVKASRSNHRTVFVR